MGTVRSRYIYSNWLYVKFDKLNYFCWVAPSVVNVAGDVSTVAYKELNLQSIGSNMYGPPKNVAAVRNGDKVTISWDQVKMTQDDDRGYLLELFVCQDTILFWWTDSHADQFSTSYTVRDEAGCAQPSSGKLYTVEKHGFSDPAIHPLARALGGDIRSNVITPRSSSSPAQSLPGCPRRFPSPGGTMYSSIPPSRLSWIR